MYSKAEGLWVVFRNSCDVKSGKLDHFTLRKWWEIS